MRIDDRGKEWWLAKLSDEIARLRAELDAATATFDDEQAAHQDTLRLWQQAKAEIAALTEQQDRTMAALRWAFPLANMAMEGHRQERLRYGHRFGTKRIGLYDKEVQQIEDARRVLASPTPQDDLEGDVKHGNAEYFRAALAHAAAKARRAAIQIARRAHEEHIAARDDALAAGNEMGALTRARQAQTASEIARAIQALASPTPQEETR